MAHLVWSIILRPKAVVEEEISRQGILPTVAPVKPYTLLALTCEAHQLGMSSDTMNLISSLSCYGCPIICQATSQKKACLWPSVAPTQLLRQYAGFYGGPNCI